MKKEDKILCVEFANNIRKEKGIDPLNIDAEEIKQIKLFSKLWYKFGLSEIDKSVEDRIYSFNDKFNTLEFWSGKLLRDEFDINYIHRKILNDEKTNFIKKSSFITATSLISFEYNGVVCDGYCIDAVPLEIDKNIKDIDNVKVEELNQAKFLECIDIAEKNLGYHNDNSDKIALNYFIEAKKYNPNDKGLNEKISILDKIVNYKNYNYPINDNIAMDLVELFVEYCNVGGFENLHNIISDDFICICRHFGRTKNEFIDSIYFERKTFVGLWTEIGTYEMNDRKIPCVILNNFGVLFFNILDFRKFTPKEK